MPLEQLGPYRILRLLGRGGMGAVYEGVHSETGERAAVKILSLTLAEDEAFRGRFAGEIETLKQLQHPNIVRLIGYGEQDGLLFYSMELVEGINLHDALAQQGRLPWQEVAEIAIQVCAALKHAHDHGVIHRDLKPANLLWTEERVIKLTDFGIAKFFGATNLTSVGGVIGTADYMSPEQAEGRGVTARSDLYSLGGVLYALLTGKPPYTGKSVTQILYKMQQQDPLPLSQHLPSLPVEFEEIVLQLLRRDPTERIATPLALSKRLRSMLHGLAAATKLEDESPAEPDAPTRILPLEPEEEVKQGEETRIESPVTRSPAPQLRGNWQDETIVTGQRGEEYQLQEMPTKHGTEKKRGPGTHFTEVKRGRKASRDRDEDESPRTWLSEHVVSTAGLVFALLVLISLGYYFTRPPAPDKLFERIEAVIVERDRGDYMDARRSMDDFLRHYPKDPREVSVRMWRVDHDAHRLWRRLEREARQKGGLEYLPPIQQEFVLASRELADDPEAAFQIYAELVARHGTASGSAGREEANSNDDNQESLRAAKHWLSRLHDEFGGGIEEPIDTDESPDTELPDTELPDTDGN